MNAHCLKVLEFDRIRDFLLSFAASPGGRRACRGLVPQKDPEAVRRLLRETAEMRAEIEINGPLPLSGIHDVRQGLDHARIQNFYLEPAALLEIADMLETAEIIRNYFAGRADAAPLLQSIADPITVLRTITQAVRRSISGQGHILDSASPALADIRARIKKLRAGIIKTLEHMLGDIDLGVAIQDDFITLRNSRYVIPVRSDSKNMIPGVVHDQSQTKATFFVEPLQVVNQNNELQGLRREEHYEELRILQELTRLVDSRGAEIRTDLDTLERIDVIHAKALFAQSLAAALPEISADGSMSLHTCRHPILLSRFVEDPPAADDGGGSAPEPSGRWLFDRGGITPIDIVKGRHTSTMIITGANAGGKTVAMKTLGLFVLMTQAGMHLPAGPGSSICLYDSVFADIGDEQDMEASLSTFSAHMAQINAIVSSVTPASLVLLDELGSGTDPSEGGALAVAVLDYLRARGCTAVVTTHLNIMKTYAYSREDAENVSVAFDPSTLKPSYSLVYGVPGFSNAIAIARSIGIPDEILRSAGGYLEGADRQVAELIHGLEKTQKDLAGQKEVLRNVVRLAQKYHNAAESLHESMKAQRDKILRSFEASARRLLRQSEDELMKIIKENRKRRIVRPDEDFAQDEKAREAVAQIKKKLHGQFPKKAEQHEALDHLEPGQAVHVVHLQKQGVVVSADDATRKAEVAVGPLRVKTQYRELSPAAPAATPAKAKPAARPARVAEAAAEPAFARKVNVIGMRVDEALPVVDKAIDTALLEGATEVEIIHGRGTGRLMAAIHEHLKAHAYVSGFSQGDPSEGGSGITIARIK